MEKTEKFSIKVSVEMHPVMERCVKEFGIDPTQTFFAFGDTIYNPGNHPIAFHVMVHEVAHLYQQKKTTPEEWWNDYLKDSKFRLEQETEAYAAQYRAYCSAVKDRNHQAKFLFWIASELSSDRYGKMISHFDASSAVKNYKLKI